MSDLCTSLAGYIEKGDLQSAQVLWRRHATTSSEEDQDELLRLRGSVVTALWEFPLHGETDHAACAEWVRHEVLPLLQERHLLEELASWAE